MLFNGENQSYVLLGRGTAALIPALRRGTTLAELVDLVGQTSSLPDQQLERRLRAVLEEMRHASLFDGLTAPQMDRGSRLARSQLKVPQFRVRLARRSADELFELLARPIHAAPVRRYLLPVLWTGGPLAYLFATLTLLGGGLIAPPSGLTLLVIFLVTILQLFFHETAHGVCCRYYGVPVREVGVSLWYYIMPVTYVDHSDTYRLPRRWPRVAISLAGPLVDMYTCGVIALFVHQAQSGITEQVWRAVLLVQCLTLLVNFNPLLPTDAVHAVEAATGQVNLRGRSISYVVHRMLRRPLPSGLSPTGVRSVRWLAWCYGVACLLYLLVMIAATGYLLSIAVRMVAGS
ncbi:site-2 protease family protein [Streptomyces sp. bgisy084]|uniref:site-2 protease family protein n=1 Tax=unclassified Streptomyces TaxID=2593676 RepID=UPI003D744E49